MRRAGSVALLAVCTQPAAPALSVDPPPEPRPIGRGPLYRPPATGKAVRAATPIRGLRCSPVRRARFGAHLELFANRYSVIVPAGIGIAPPLRRDGPYVRSGRCSYALRTREPTGVIEVARGAPPTLGDFFAVWGQPLSARRLAGFRAHRGDRVRAYVAGRLWRKPLGRIPLSRHAQIVLEVGGYVRPHPRYLFPSGL